MTARHMGTFAAPHHSVHRHYAARPGRAVASGVGTVMHREMESMIPDFLRDRLDEANLGTFLRHTQDCPSCQDELMIQYLVRVGMEKAETGESFNLEKDLEDYLELETKRYLGRRFLRYSADIMEIIALTMVVVAAISAWI